MQESDDYQVPVVEIDSNSFNNQFIPQRVAKSRQIEEPIGGISQDYNVMGEMKPRQSESFNMNARSSSEVNKPDPMQFQYQSDHQQYNQFVMEDDS